MAKNWYPIIDRTKCLQCHDCVNFCSHGVYALDCDGFPEVVKPEACVEFCRGCSKICESKAISYFGEGGK
jgi:NAD-dependent dihydropyrimidine dehydrogenase PreA subunit